MLFWGLISLCAVVVVVAIFAIWTRRRRRHIAPQIYGETPDPTTYRIMATIDGRLPFNRRSWTAAQQSDQWRAEMLELGERLASAGVDSITYAHGTFVGNDPLSFVRMLKGLVPRFSGRIEETLSVLAKLQTDIILRDNGNFVPEYAAIVQDALGAKLPVRLFNWGSGNNHLHRVQGALRLARMLASSTTFQGDGCQHMLVIGHSHAGQMFAILTQLLDSATHAAELIEIAEESGEDTSHVAESLARLRRCKLDFVTLGTPPRYGWGTPRNFRLLNLVNHRGDVPRAGNWHGLLHTLHGDYVQQWGIVGSDFIAASAKERALNQRLDALLDVGISPKVWFESARHLKRVPSSGYTFLIDYGDAGKLVANCLATIFGHGVYTRLDVMQFNLKLIVDYFYSGSDKL